MFAEVVSTLKHKNLHSMRIMACKKNLKQNHKFTSEQTHKKLANPRKFAPNRWFYTLKHFISDLFMNKKDYTLSLE